MAGKLLDAFETLKKEHANSVARITGCGTAYGIWIKDPEGVDDKKACFKVVYSCFERGLFTQRLGSSFLRCEPQYTISDEELSRCFSIIDGALIDLEKNSTDKDAMKYYIS